MSWREREAKASLLTIRDPKSELTSPPKAPFDKLQSKILWLSIAQRKSKLDRVQPMTPRSRGLLMNFDTLFKRGAIDSSRRRSFWLSYARKNNCTAGSVMCFRM